MDIRSLSEVPVLAIKDFTDQEIGADYYSEQEIVDMVKRSQINNVESSFVIVEHGKVCGVRIAFPPGAWQKGKGYSLSPHLWPHPQSKTAYFQSLFIGKKFQKQGWGKELSKNSIQALEKQGALGIVCHSWVESPGNSSQKYLASLQFRSICRYPEYWKQVDYTCPRCGKPCLCTAEEMYLDLKETSH